MYTQEDTSERNADSPSPSGSNWNSRSLGRNWQHQFFYVAIRLGGRRLAYFFSILSRRTMSFAVAPRASVAPRT